MQNPTSPTEQLFFTTMRVEASKGPNVSSGTGFIVMVETDNGTILVLVTNRHVLLNALAVRLIGAAASADGATPAYGQRSVVLAQPPSWIGHPDLAIDVAALVVTGLPLLGSQQPFLKALPVELLINEPSPELVDAIEPVTFVGYPNALFDSVNMTPIARRGWTATPIALDYGGTPTFLIDASVFPGSSGSPVFILDVGGYGAKGGGWVVGSRLFLVGILASVHVQKTSGTIVTVGTGQIQVDQMIDLGIVYKASTILETIDHLLSTRGETRVPSVSGTVSAVVPVEPPVQSVP